MGLKLWGMACMIRVEVQDNLLQMKDITYSTSYWVGMEGL